MADYSRQHDFSVKDALTTGDPDKVIKGSEADEEFDALVTAVASKINVLTGHTTNDIAYLNSVGQLVDAGILYTDLARLTTTQTITGDKTFSGAATFSGATIVPTPSADTHAVTKAYADAVLKPGTAVTMNPFATSSSATANHELGAQPTLVDAYLECLTTDNGYAVGDRVRIDSFDAGGAGTRAVMSGANATAVFLSTGTTAPVLSPKTGGAGVAITAASWKFVATPYLTN